MMTGRNLREISSPSNAVSPVSNRKNCVRELGGSDGIDHDILHQAAGGSYAPWRTKIRPLSEALRFFI
jgi:hypothetical protein